MSKWIILCLFIVYAHASIETITNDNFDSFKYKNAFFLIHFHGVEDELHEMMHEISTNGPQQIVYGGSNDMELAERLDVVEFPKLKWFMGGSEYEFRGEYTYAKVLKLLIAATTDWATPIENHKHLENFLAIPDKYAVVVSNDKPVDLRGLATILPSLRFGHLRHDGENLFPEGTLRVYSNFNGLLSYVEFNGEGNIIPWIKNQTTPAVVSTDWEIFKVVYDYSDWHLLFFGVEYSDIQRLSEVYSPEIIFVDVRKDHTYLREKFNVTETPACVFVNKSHQVLNHTHVPLESVVDYIDYTILGEEKPKDEL